MIENQEIDYSKLSEILAETEEPAFFKCFFNGTALRSLKAENAVFNDCKMSSIDFSYSDFNGAVFRNCDLNNCNFNGCRLFDAKFENCKLSGSDFSDTSNLNCEFDPKNKNFTVNRLLWPDIPWADAFLVTLFGFRFPRCLIFKKPSFFFLRKMAFSTDCIGAT